MTHPAVKLFTVPIGVLAVYFVVPVDADRAPVGVLAGVLVSAASLAGVVFVVFTEARSAQRRLTGWHLVLLLEIALVVFSFTYYLVAAQHPEEFEGLSTRLDAMYFATATVATVGYGDVHPVGQLARTIVTVHMIFNLVFIGAVVNLARDRMSERRASRERDAGDPPDQE